MKTTTLTAPEIECQGCASAIKKSVGAVAGVSDIQVDIDTKRVTVTHELATTPESIKAAMAKAGFTTS